MSSVPIVQTSLQWTEDHIMVVPYRIYVSLDTRRRRIGELLNSPTAWVYSDVLCRSSHQYSIFFSKCTSSHRHQNLLTMFPRTDFNRYIRKASYSSHYINIGLALSTALSSSCQSAENTLLVSEFIFYQ